jgi:hypothetical protein
MGWAIHAVVPYMDERRRLVGAGSLMSSDTNDSASLVEGCVHLIVDGECQPCGS